MTVSHTLSAFSPEFLRAHLCELGEKSSLRIPVQAHSSSISKKMLWEGCVLPLLHFIFTARHYDDRRTKKDFWEVEGVPRWNSALKEPLFLSISLAHNTNCGVRIKFLMALTDKQAQNGLNSASCFETEHEIMIPKPHQHKAHLRPIKKIKHMS